MKTPIIMTIAAATLAGCVTTGLSTASNEELVNYSAEELCYEYDALKQYSGSEVVLRQLKILNILGTRKDLTPRELTDVSENIIRTGMSETALQCLEGEPDTVNRSNGIYGSHAQWVYDYSYYYFDDGKLTSWQY